MTQTEQYKFLISAGGKLSFITDNHASNVANVGVIVYFDNGSKVLETFRKRILNQPFYKHRVNPKTWIYEEDKLFNVENHIIDKTNASIHDHFDEIAKKMNEDLPRDRPMWHYTFFSDGCFGRAHHILGDGHAMSYLFAMLSDEAKDVVDETEKDIYHHFNMPNWKKFILTVIWYLWYFFWLPYVLCKMAYTYLRKETRSSLYGRASVKKQVVVMKPIDLDEAKQVAHKFHGTINDLMLGVTSGMLRRHFEDIKETPQDVHIAVPFDVRSHPEEFKEIANYFGFIVTRLPVTKPSAKNRISSIKNQMDWVKRTPEPQALYHMMSMGFVLPDFFTKWLYSISCSKITGLITNVRGSPHPLHIAGQELKRFIPVSPSPSGTAFSIMITGYNNTLSVSMLLDTVATTKPENFEKFFLEEYEAIKKQVL